MTGVIHLGWAVCLSSAPFKSRKKKKKIIIEGFVE